MREARKGEKHAQQLNTADVNGYRFASNAPINALPKTAWGVIWNGAKNTASSAWSSFSNSLAGTMTIGAVQALGGVGEMVFGAGLIAGTEGAGLIPGGALMAHGADDIWTGLATFATGEYQDTYTSTVVTQATGSKLLGTLADLAVPAGAGIAAKIGSAGSALRIGSKSMGGVASMAGRLGDDVAHAGSRMIDDVARSAPRQKYLFQGCFVADTPIAAEFGLKPIQNVVASDLVWAFDLATGRWRLCRVLETYTNDYVGDLIEIEVGGDVIESTYHHPVWVVSGDELERRPNPDHVAAATVSDSAIPGRWVDAGDLRVGDVLLLRSDRQVQVAALRARAVVTTVYNFQVEDLHNYAVGAAGVLAHNNAPCVYQIGGIADDVVAPRGVEFPAFRPGDSITKALPDGSYPKWFAREAAEKANTIQGRYWMNRAAAAAPDEFTSRQLDKMRAGFAPEMKVRVQIRATGDIEIRKVSKELHHNLGGRGTVPFDEPIHLREVWPWQHEMIDQFRHTEYDFLSTVD